MAEEEENMAEWIRYRHPPAIRAAASVVGKKEHDGPLGTKFDLHDEKDKFGQPSWEQAESEMQRLALNLAMTKGGVTEKEIDVLFAGDLINQCTGSAYGLLDYRIPYFGLYGACSTAAESLILASMMIDGGYARRSAAVTSSHNLSAERQFRYPVEYGGQRAPTAQWTVTGSGAFLLDAEGDGPFVTEVMPGISADPGISDLNNMGAAMAPAIVCFGKMGTENNQWAVPRFREDRRRALPIVSIILSNSYQSDSKISAPRVVIHRNKSNDRVSSTTMTSSR